MEFRKAELLRKYAELRDNYIDSYEPDFSQEGYTVRYAKIPDPCLSSDLCSHRILRHFEAKKALFPRLYNTEPEVRSLAAGMIMVAASFMPVNAFNNASYFTLRSGGKTFITFLFDAVYTWAVTVLLAFLLTRFTDMAIVEIYFCVQFIDVIKLVIGLLMLRSDFWARNVVSDI